MNITYLRIENGFDISKITGAIYGLSECDEEFKTKFKQLLNETKQRFQKEFDDL